MNSLDLPVRQRRTLRRRQISPHDVGRAFGATMGIARAHNAHATALW